MQHDEFDGYALCQDCGRADAAGSLFCLDCGGELCGCNACVGIARLSIQFQASLPLDADQVKGTPGSRSEAQKATAFEHRTGEAVGEAEPLTRHE